VKAGHFVFEHGHKIGKGSRASILEEVTKRFNEHLSVVRGHHHSEMGDHIKPIWMPGGWQQRVVFTGCLMDRDYASYTRAGLAIGCVVIKHGVPIPIPMVRDRENRWVGTLPGY